MRKLFALGLLLCVAIFASNLGNAEEGGTMERQEFLLLAHILDMPVDSYARYLCLHIYLPV